MQDHKYLLEKVCEIAHKAGIEILKVYNQPNFEVQCKTDNSPLTTADLAANKIIVDGLKKLTPDIPALSEESNHIDYSIRKDWNKYWLIDPLDGTKEFIARNDEFTVNIALMENNKPVLGVIYAPCLSKLASVK